MSVIIDYFWTKLPRKISKESRDMLKRDLKNICTFNINPWSSGQDREARKKNREWMKLHAKTFVNRWAYLSVVLWSLTWLSSGFIFISVPLTLTAFLASIVTIIFIYAHRVLNAPGGTL